jgi:hypothetical protein
MSPCFEEYASAPQGEKRPTAPQVFPTEDDMHAYAKFGEINRPPAGGLRAPCGNRILPYDRNVAKPSFHASKDLGDRSA